MTLRRLWSVALLGALLGCHEDPPVNLLFAPPLVDGIHILAAGGVASAGGPLASQGGTGGAIRAFTNGDLRLGSADVTPLPPTAPVFPTDGIVLTSASFQAHQDINVPIGNIQITGSVTTDVAGPPGVPRKIIAAAGDIVVTGILQSGNGTGLDASGHPLHAMADLELDAPGGTIYVSGLIQTASVDGIPDGTSGGALTLVARQIVILGSINSSGESSTGPQGGNGGAVTMSVPAPGAGLLFRDGTLNTAGGSGSTQGGQGGGLTLNILGGAVFLFGNIATGGGLANGSLGSVQGGAGGTIALVASSTVTVNAQMGCHGGDALTGGGAASGGVGGSFALTNAPGGAHADVRLFGTLDLTGGQAASASTGPTVTSGGQGGSAQLGQPGSPLISLLSGSSVLDSSGGPGDQGGTASPITLSSIGPGAGDLILSGTFLALGGDGGVGPGGPGGAMALSTGSSGNLTLSGVVQTDGGASSLDAGGDAGSVTVTGAAGSVVNLASSARITATAGAGGSSGGAGAAGSIQMSLANGAMALTGTLEALGGSSPLEVTSLGAPGPSSGGLISLHTDVAGGGLIDCRASLLVLGGSSSANPGVSVPGAPGGTVQISTLSPGGQITMESGCVIQADGGVSTGSHTGGTGGNIRLSTARPSIGIFGLLTARGGSAAGFAGTGGLGGLFSATTDSLNSGGTLGDLTVLAGTLIDVSGGPGFHGGNAQGDGRRFSVSNPVAVLLQAEAVAGKTNAGSVVNLGTILATGAPGSGSGGDILFLGTGAGGAGAPQPGILSVAASGSGVPGDFSGTP